MCGWLIAACKMLQTRRINRLCRKCICRSQQAPHGDHPSTTPPHLPRLSLRSRPSARWPGTAPLGTAPASGVLPRQVLPGSNTSAITALASTLLPPAPLAAAARTTSRAAERMGALRMMCVRRSPAWLHTPSLASTKRPPLGGSSTCGHEGESFETCCSHCAVRRYCGTAIATLPPHKPHTLPKPTCFTCGIGSTPSPIAKSPMARLMVRPPAVEEHGASGQ